MKKVSLALLAVVVTVFACQKNDKKSEESTEAAPPHQEQVSGRICASNEILEQQLAKDPARAKFLEDLEAKTKAYNGQKARFYAGTLYVPVVIQIVLPNPNIVTDEQIRSQIAVLNADFTKTNTELSNSSVYLAGYPLSSVANCNIKYVVTDIKRTATTVSSFGTNDAVKKTSQGGSDPISPTTKMNMWVCDLSSGYLGYAQFPGGSASTDGVVIDYQAFGTTASYSLYAQFNKGRTATHEIGHWVNLRHIWGDRRCGTDYVDDTPAHDASNGGCPSSTLRSACSGKPLEQWMNYMDYTDDRCMYMFSNGQKLRMETAIDAARKPYFLTSAPTSII